MQSVEPVLREVRASDRETLSQDSDNEKDHFSSTELRNMAEMENNELPENYENAEGSSRTQPAPLRRQASTYTPYMEDRLKRKLKFHFMAPHEKYSARRKLPWKLLLQILKIIIVTVQLVIFGYERSGFVDYVEMNNLALKHLYLKLWDPSYETMPYPPATGQYAIYTLPDLISYVNFAVENYYKTEELALGTFKLLRQNDTMEGIQPLVLCSIHFDHDIEVNGTFSLDLETIDTCRDVRPLLLGTNHTTGQKIYSFNVQEIFANESFTMHFERSLMVKLKFTLMSYRIYSDSKNIAPECFTLHGMIVFDDSNRDGQMLIDLQSTLEENTCSGKYSHENEEKADKLKNTAFDSFVIVISVVSSILCTRSIIRSQKLRKRTSTFFKKKFRKDLTISDKLEFLNLWYVVIVCNDVLTVIGSALKITIENRKASSSSENYDLCSMMLGTGSLLVWIGVLRYIGFFKTFNILVITLKKSFPDMIRFLVCALMIYFGFVFCGWLVLGPYHIKFRHLSTSSECLYSLINGDDMFVTFSATVTKNNLIWYFSRVYLYIFISLFIYAVLNLFTSVILDTYETIKEYYRDGFPKSELFRFIDECSDPPNSPAYRREDATCNPLDCLMACCRKNNPDVPNEHTSLLSVQ